MSLELAVVLVVGFVILGIGIGLPIPFVFGYAGLGLFFLVGTADPFLLGPGSLFIMRGFSFLALPLYISLGRLMEAGTLAERLITFINALLGRGKAAFGEVVVVFCAVFGAVTGSSGTAIATLGTILIPRAVEQGYDRQYLTGLVAPASLISILIPPSLTMIIFGATAQISIATCFLTTAVPGILVITFYLVINFFLTRKFSPPIQPSVSGTRGREIVRTGIRAATALMLPVIILGGIYGGVFTPTEAAAVAIIWIILDGFLIHREFVGKFIGALMEAGKLIGAVATIVFFVMMMSVAMIYVNVPDLLMSFTTSLAHSKFTFLIMANVLILLLGMIMDDLACTILCAILLLPVAVQYGVNPYHFAAIAGVNTGIANLTPPVAPHIYFASVVGGVPVNFFPPNRYMKTIFTYLLFGHLPVLIMVTYIPEISLFLPSSLGLIY